MIRLFALVVLGSTAIAQSSLPAQLPQEDAIPAPAVAPASAALPAPPAGKSTVIGGQIRNVDPVLDQLTLKVFGGKQTMNILFDERTQVYRDGSRISVLDLRPDDHASIETTLDGDRVFALRIHMLSQLPRGECRGEVLSFNPENGNLTVNAVLSRESIRLRVPPGTPVVRVGQKSFSGQPGGMADLALGSLVDVTFQPGRNGRGVATHIDVLATSGSVFVFRGNVSILDEHTGLLEIVDPTDNQTYRFSFDPSLFPVSARLHEGSPVKITANFDGAKYLISEITME